VEAKPVVTQNSPARAVCTSAAIATTATRGLSDLSPLFEQQSRKREGRMNSLIGSLDLLVLIVAIAVWKSTFSKEHEHDFVELDGCLAHSGQVILYCECGEAIRYMTQEIPKAETKTEVA
jgi:hypothetical protein